MTAVDGAAAIPAPRAGGGARGARRPDSALLPCPALLPVAADLSMALLAAGIPLTLLLDLAEHFGPLSSHILATEGRVSALAS